MDLTNEVVVDHALLLVVDRARDNVTVSGNSAVDESSKKVRNLSRVILLMRERQLRVVEDGVLKVLKVPLLVGLEDTVVVTSEDRTGVKSLDGDTELPELLVKSAAEGLESVLGSRVRTGEGVSGKTSDRRGEDDLSATLLNEVAGNLLGKKDSTEDVDLELTTQAVLRDVNDGTTLTNTGVVDKNVNVPGSSTLTVTLVGDVQLLDGDGQVLKTSLPTKAVDLVDGLDGSNDVVTLAGKDEGSVVTETTASTSDQDSLGLLLSGDNLDANRDRAVLASSNDLVVTEGVVKGVVLGVLGSVEVGAAVDGKVTVRDLQGSATDGARTELTVSVRQHREVRVKASDVVEGVDETVVRHLEGLLVGAQVEEVEGRSSVVGRNIQATDGLVLRLRHKTNGLVGKSHTRESKGSKESKLHCEFCWR